MSAPDHRLVGSNALDPVAAQTRARAAFGAMAASPAARRKARAAVYALVGALVVLGYAYPPDLAAPGSRGATHDLASRPFAAHLPGARRPRRDDVLLSRASGSDDDRAVAVALATPTAPPDVTDPLGGALDAARPDDDPDLPRRAYTKGPGGGGGAHLVARGGAPSWFEVQKRRAKEEALAALLEDGDDLSVEVEVEDVEDDAEVEAEDDDAEAAPEDDASEASPDEEAEDACHATPNAEFWGPNAPGLPQGPANPQPDEWACCASCREHGPERCNAWTFDPDRRECWLKRLPTAYQAMTVGAHVRFVSGAIYPHQPLWTEHHPMTPDDAEPGSDGSAPPTCLHTMITSNGQPYMNWQTRVFYRTWLAASAAPGSPLRHFTRVLHRTRDDELMREIPTVRIDPTHPECDRGCDYAVKDRARAIARWAELPDARRCSHVLMAEADYLMVASPPPSVMLDRGHAYGFLFGYIIPWHKDAMPASLEFYDPSEDTGDPDWFVRGGGAETTLGGSSDAESPRPRPRMEDVPQSGNAPQVIHADDLRAIAPVWADMVELGEANEKVKKIFGWVRDMYAFDFAALKTGLTIHYPPVPWNKLMVQPPADATLGHACLMHYTWSPILSDNTGKTVWRFDKRQFGGAAGSTSRFTILEEQPLPPAWDPGAGFKLQAGEVVTEEGLELMRLMAETFNAGVRSLPGRYPEGTRSDEDVARARGEG